MADITSIDSLLKVIKDNHISAKNKSKWNDLSICINIIEMPDTRLSLMTVSILFDGERRNSMPTTDFARCMSIIESILGETWFDDVHIPDLISDYVCVPLVSVLDDSWYRVTKAHRLFFIPMEKTMKFVDLLVDNSFNFESFYVKGIIIYMKTGKYNGTIRIPMS